MPQGILSEQDQQEIERLIRPQDLSASDAVSLAIAARERDSSQGMSWRAPRAPQMTTLDLVGLLGLAPLALGGGKGGGKSAPSGMVRTGERIGPARLQKLYDYVVKNKELFPDVRFNPESEREAIKIGKIGQGIEGSVYRVGKMTLKDIVSRETGEAEAAYRLRGEPGFKHFLGTVAEARKDLPEPSKHSEIMDYISKGIVKSEDINLLGLFTRFEPGLERHRPGSPQAPNIDLLREIVAAALRAGVLPTDVHQGNVQYTPSSKGLSIPTVIDLGLSNLEKRKAAGWQYDPQFPKDTQSLLLNRIIMHLVERYGSRPDVEAIKKRLIKGKISAEGGER